MSEHLSTAQLQDYGSRALPPREAGRVVAHLDECAACFAAFRGLFPALADPQREVVLESWPDDEPFHLDYELHLQPFVDGETDDVDNEIITGHVAVCAPCGQALRELQEFRDSLLWQQAAHAAPSPGVRARFAGWWHAHRRAVSLKSFAWALGLLLIVGGGLWFAWRRQATQRGDVARTEPPATPTPLPVTAPVPPPPATPRPAASPREAATPEDEPPPGVPVEVAQAIRAQRLVFPPALNGLGLSPAQNGDPRGAGPDAPPTKAPMPQTPLGVVREARPLLRWAGATGRQYQVTIADAQNNIVAVSPKLTQTAWRPANALPPGRLRWQVVAVETSGPGVSGPLATIYRLSPAEESRLRRIEQTTTSALARGVAYAQAGLLTEAAQAFRQWLTQHPDSETARKLLTQVEAR
jgi:predicted anti-sigma-YlaC factor YlaD